MRRRELVPILATVVLTVAGLLYTVAADNEPLLGLDLQGGVSVVLQPTEDASQEALDQAVGIMRRRVDALGVAEPEVAAQGDSIIVSLPGVDDPQRALDLVGQTAALRFRPVLEVEDPLAVAAGDGEPIDAPTTAPDDAQEDEEVVLEELDDEGDVIARYRLGPTAVRGEAVADANAQLEGVSSWFVALELRAGDDAIGAWNDIAATCFARQPECPTGLLGIELDNSVISAPIIQTPEFTRDQISINGDFTEGEAKDLALVLRFGALPVELEPQQTQTVSATIGRDALDAGIVAGLVGLGLVTLFMVAYYRVLGVVAIVSLLISFGLLWTIISWFGATQGLALTLAGVTGLIISIGVSVDSNIVYFENLKEDVRDGRPVRSAVERSFSSAFSTIVKADVTTLIGAALLYWLSIGPVRGFAFYLGLATLLDLVVSYFFMGPLVVALGRSRRFHERPGWLGIPRRRDDVASSVAVGGAS
ncbi:protein translocase subunit SecD [Actinomarinicola tropica]|uniref:Protein translocase subunit SecD n=1 Tax=Actinomarinicola tropica TaxID=2789776 RepID=A0A5Q2RPL4_9ACTN|nr:protein translocase subunit SecD [Actinomarinicola tropica]QGG95155.1 protein translocase subunit SecD [Actinomarinicola tropica]